MTNTCSEKWPVLTILNLMPQSLSDKENTPKKSIGYVRIAFKLFLLTPSGRSSKGQHSAPRGGPPRSWTNDDLTKALENVWNKRMTTSQASRVFGIPYNSLLMYVRGKYGKSLRLDVLKKSTPAANDNLNTIGNSRSTPKEKGLKREVGSSSGESGGLKREDWLKERGGGRKSSQSLHHHEGAGGGSGGGGGGPMSSLFNFDPAALGGPFGGGMLHFPPLGEPLGLLGLGMPTAGTHHFLPFFRFLLASRLY